MSSPTAPTGYGPRFKQFDGDANKYDLWEEHFLGALDILELHLALDKYASERPEGYNPDRA